MTCAHTPWLARAHTKLTMSSYYETRHNGEGAVQRKAWGCQPLDQRQPLFAQPRREILLCHVPLAKDRVYCRQIFAHFISRPGTMIKMAMQGLHVYEFCQWKCKVRSVADKIQPFPKRTQSWSMNDSQESWADCLHFHCWKSSIAQHSPHIAVLKIVEHFNLLPQEWLLSVSSWVKWSAWFSA